MIIQTKDLTGAALDWAVAKAAGIDFETASDGTACINRNGWLVGYEPSKNWSQCGALLECSPWALPYRAPGHIAHLGNFAANTPSGFQHTGDTPLIAACRAIVAAALGSSVDVPDELV